MATQIVTTQTVHTFLVPGNDAVKKSLRDRSQLTSQYQTLSACVCIMALVIRHAKSIFPTQHYIVMCGHTLPHYFINRTIFGKHALNVKCAF